MPTSHAIADRIVKQHLDVDSYDDDMEITLSARDLRALLIEAAFQARAFRA